MTKATVDGIEVKIGDWVGFKSDVEQYGQIVEIKRHPFGAAILVLENKGGFDGHYIHGKTRTEQHADHCWVE